MISRIIFIIVLLAVGYLLLKSWQRKKLIQKNTLDKSATTQQKSPPQQMVRCTYCSLHIPEPEAVAEGGRFFCCLEHARLMKSQQ
ncbi:PP0621 family protein [Thiofilum flexile]|uniref:PP0621 family protein n=1 Tax=Thiofilum flexile TaxID=125627 RepID=UPI003CCBE88C